MFYVIVDEMIYVLQRKGQFTTDLHAAVISQDLGALKQLNHKGADLSAKNQVCYSALYVADTASCLLASRKSCLPNLDDMPL